MQKDFHFYAIYVIAKAAGFPNQLAYDLAYASQYTDDNDDKETINFVDGGKFLATLTQHIGINFADKKLHQEVYVPFHFLPGAAGKTMDEKLLTVADNAIAQSTVTSAIEAVNKGARNGIQKLGIAIHSYADTWSHQNFAGKISKVNKATIVKVPGIDDIDGFLTKFQDDFFAYILSPVLPTIGHLQLANLVDEPYRIEWVYKNYKGIEIKPKYIERFMSAAKAIYDQLLLVSDSVRSGKEIVWDALLWPLHDCLSQNGTLEERLKHWNEAFEGSNFPRVDVKKIEYDDWEWFNDALEYWNYVRDPAEKTDIAKKEQFKTKPGFSTSKWRYFQDAAREQKDLVLKKLLPKYKLTV